MKINPNKFDKPDSKPHLTRMTATTRQAIEATVAKFNPKAVNAFQDYAKEAEHMDGVTYWDYFANVTEAIEDFEMWVNETSYNLDIFAILDGLREQAQQG